MKTTTPYDWVRHVEPELVKIDSTPLIGASPPFPWEQLSGLLSKCFSLTPLTIRPGELQWRSANQLLDGLGDHPIPLYLSVPTLKGSLTWVMAEEEINLLMSLILTKESHPLPFQDPELRESFCQFVYLETLFQLSQTTFDKTVSPTITHQASIPAEDALCLDVSIALDSQVLWGRLIISPEFRQGWAEKYAQQGPSPRAKEIAKEADVLLHLEIGRSSLSLPEWSMVKSGDFLPINQCDWNPDTASGHLTITSNSMPVFSGLAEGGHIKIIEFTHFYEANTPMSNNPPSKDDPKEDPKENHEENEELPEELTGEEDFTFEDEESFELTLDESTSATVAPTTAAAEKKPAAAVPPPPPAAPKAPPKPAATPAAAPISVAKAEEPKAAKTHLSPGEIPINLIVEVGRIHMTVEKLLSLEPGNLLELDIHPENGIDLVVNTKKVGKGELIRIGESLGVRILEIG